MINNFRNNTLKTDYLPKRYHSIHELKSLEEFPDTKSMVIADMNGGIIYSNHSFENTFRLKEQQNLIELDSEPGLNFLSEGFAASKYSSFQFELFIPGRPDHSPSFYFVEVERIIIGEGEYFILIFTSMEERRKIENKINSLHNALEYGNVPVLITDTDGRINYSTKSFESILNTNIEGLYGKPITGMLSDFLDVNELEDIRECIKEASGCKKIISDIDSEGNIWYKELTLTPARSIENDTSGFILTANDITDYVLKTRIIKRSEERQKSIINNISDLLLIVRNEKENLYFENANDNFLEVFSFKREQVFEKNLEDVFDRQFLGVLTDAISRLIKYESPYEEFRYSRYSKFREYLGTVTFTDDHYGEQRIFIVSFKDITEQLSNEEKLRKAYERETHINKLKSSFLANMSHEVRTPLNAIVGYTELIEDDVKAGENESALTLFTYLKEGYTRLLNLVDNIMEVSLIQSGETELDMRPMLPNETLRKVYMKMYPLAEKKGMAFDIDIEDPELIIRADSAKLEKVVSMLVDNAIKYTAEGSILLGCRMEKGMASIIIADTGRGIKQENIDRMFEPFSQEDEGHKREYEGAGLGLTIAYNLTKMMGGGFDVKSTENVGTTITLSFGRIS